MDELTLEREYFSRGFAAVCGVDEVGRGPLAGPVVCAAVILPLGEEQRIRGIDDSKKLSAAKRERLAEEIKRPPVPMRSRRSTSARSTRSTSCKRPVSA